jgi:hypothetical protein
VTRNPEAALDARFGAPVLLLLIALVLSASAQRLWFLVRRPVPVLRGEPPAVAADQQLSLRPLAGAPDGLPYKVDALVAHLQPAAVLQNRRLARAAGGTVALGRTAGGEPALQTCLMVTGKAAVTEDEISREIRASAPPGRLRALRRHLNNLLFSTPMRRRECLLVILRANGPASDAAEARLLASWRQLQPQLVPLWR